MAVDKSKRIYMRDLTKIINRRPATIRVWEREMWLPQNLLPRRDEKGWRYWTKSQVKGLQAWMKQNDMRPGRLVADPEAEEEHIKNLRRPRYINGHHVRSIRAQVEKGKTREQIIKNMYPKTQYTSPERLEDAIVKYFQANAWEFPEREDKPKMNVTQQSEIKRLEKRVRRVISAK